MVEFGSLQHPKFKLFLYGLETYMGLEFILASISLLVRKLLGIELEPQFNKPYLSTSLQDFWGRRWNLMVNKILHPTIYKPVMNVSTRVIGRKWAPLPTIISTFAVSGLMHELVYYYVKRENTRLKRENLLGILCVFSSFMGCIWLLRLLLKKNELKGKWKLSRWVSSPLTVVFVIYTTLLLFVPTLVRYHVFEKEIKELNAIVEFGLDPYGSYFLKK
ncbi:putative long-chain-alcohol O-fatty-acyltransferase [Lupinus albus]|uniref:Putative long-chain-alcohol O-fatty-acyltransferase n=1 Tax=Lupinus albus TaxID=3870 RepID=A0A6A4NQP4_LUPAL|nr:putative long-chain-alcohol O-fatty-acyltransferase [Lupinus albus]